MIRWKCEKCDKVWIYPVKKCLYCKQDIKRVRLSANKITAVSKVIVPSPLHPIVPYNVILLEDNHGNRIPRKTMKDYKIGDLFVEEKAKTTEAVSIVKIKYDLLFAIEKSLDLINFYLDTSSKVVIKPSIEIAAYPYQAVCTNPKVLDALISVLISKGVKKENISVAEQSLDNTTKAAAKSGILEVCKKQDIKFIDISSSEFIEKAIEDYKFNISKHILDADVLINLPVMKTHYNKEISGALENMRRVADIPTQKRMSASEQDNQIVLLNKLLKYVTVADMSNGMHGQGPYLAGEPAFLNIIMASKNPVAIDGFFSELGMFDIPSYVKLASEKGLGNLDVENVGYELEACKLELKKASNLSPNPRIKVIGKSYEKEEYYLFSLLNKFNNIPINKTNIVIGRMFCKEDIPSARVVAFGEDAIARLKELGVLPMAEISSIDGTEAYVLLKKILVSKKGASLNLIDKAKSKIISKISKIGG